MFTFITMKRILLPFFLLCSLFAVAQMVTNRQMYNFNVGDTVQWSSPFTLCWQPGMYEERVFLGKQENSGYVLYTVKDTRKYQCGSCPFPDEVVIHDIQINDSDTSVLFSETPVFPNCIYNGKRDTFYTDESLGGKVVYGIIYGQHQTLSGGSSCEMQGSMLFIEGVGELYDLIVVRNFDPCVYKRKLEFYHKTGELPYGKRVIEPPAPPPPSQKLEIYPTVITDHVIFVDYEGEEDMQVQFSAIDGRIVGEEIVKRGSNSYNLNVNTGLYMVKFISPNSFNGKFRKIMIQDK